LKRCNCTDSENNHSVQCAGCDEILCENCTRLKGEKYRCDDCFVFWLEAELTSANEACNLWSTRANTFSTGLEEANDFNGRLQKANAELMDQVKLLKLEAERYREGKV